MTPAAKHSLVDQLMIRSARWIRRTLACVFDLEVHLPLTCVELDLRVAPARLKTNRGSEEGFDLGVLWVQGQREYRGLVPPTALFLEQSIPIGND
jgi:hypothetical protein